MSTDTSTSAPARAEGRTKAGARADGDGSAPRTRAKRDRSRAGRGETPRGGGASPPAAVMGPAATPAAAANGRTVVTIADAGADWRPEVDTDRPLRVLTLTRAGADPASLVGMTDRDAELVRELAGRTGDTDLARVVRGAAAYGFAVLIRTDLPPIV